MSTSTQDKKTWHNLSDLRSDRDLTKGLRRDLKRWQQQRKRELQKEETDKEQNTDSEYPEAEKVKKPVNARVPQHDRKYAENSVLVADLNQCERLLNQCYDLMKQRATSFEAVALLLSSAYAKATTLRMKQAISKARRKASSIASASTKQEKVRLKLREKGMPNNVIRRTLRQNYTLPKVDPLTDDMQSAMEEILTEKRRLEGAYFTDVHQQFEVDLTKHDQSLEPVVLTRAAIIMGVHYPIDVAAVHRKDPSLEIEHLESFLYHWRNALVIGYRASSLPKGYNEAKLRQDLAQKFQLDAVPVSMPMSHHTSKRIWFVVPEFAMKPRYVSFADRQVNRDMEGLRFLNGAPSPDEIRFVLTKEGYPKEDLELLLDRISKFSSQRDQMNFLYQEYMTFMHRKKSVMLRDRKARFDEQHADTLREIKLLREDILMFREHAAELKADFGKLTSPTAEPEDGLNIGGYSKLHDVFSALEKSAVRGDRNSQNRQRIREILFADRLQARLIYYAFKDVQAKLSETRRALKAKEAKLEYARSLANNELQELEEVG